MAGVGNFLKSENENGGLLLYQYYPSYYCQKVVFALHEKKLKFKTHVIDLFNSEQYEPWFIQLNPKCEVPVLKDGVKIIPDSRRIIDYLEDNFSNGNTPRLLPEKGSPQYHLVERMRDMLDSVPIGLVTYGCIHNPHISGTMKLSPEELKTKQTMICSHLASLNELSTKYKDFKDHYLAKISAKDKFLASVEDAEEIEKGILDIEYALKQVENMLSSNKEDKKDWWLCSENFSIADISLGIMLNRLYMLGLDDRFFKDNNFPNVQSYFKRVQQRDSFRKTINKNESVLKSFSRLDSKEQVFATVGGVAVVLCAAGIAAFLLHRIK